MARYGADGTPQPESRGVMLDECVFPELVEPFDTALREAVRYALERYQPLLGLIAAGSIVRGEGDPLSDIDLFVLFESDYRQLVHKHFNGVPVQLFCNPPQRIPLYFEEQAQRTDGGPSTAHMLATGFVVLDRDPRIGQFRQQAKTLLQQPPQLDEGALARLRYTAADVLENILDLQARDPDMARLMLGEALPRMMRYHFLKQGRAIPRHKEWLVIIRREDPPLSRLIHALYAAYGEAQFEIALQIADKTIGTRGFFDYKWPPEKVD